MPSPRKVDLLPAEVREELNRRIVDGGFGGYVDLSDWLAGRGYEIGKSVLAEHGGRLRHRIEAVRLATEQAEALVQSTRDDGNALADASLRMVQEALFDVLLASEERDPKTLANVARAFADVARASERIRDARKKAVAEAAERQEKAIKEHGISGDLADALRRALYE